MTGGSKQQVHRDKKKGKKSHLDSTDFKKRASRSQESRKRAKGESPHFSASSPKILGSNGI